MYIPAAHEEDNIPTLQNLIHENPLGLLTTAIPHEGQPLILSSHIPFILKANKEDVSDLGCLQGHLARQNPQSKAMMASLPHQQGDFGTLEQEVLVMFTKSESHYVTPKFYTETKPSTAKVVPTWNYAAVEVYGRATIYYDSQATATSDFLSRQIDSLSEHAERHIMNFTGEGDRPEPWKVADAPERYLELMKRNIIGIEIRIERLNGKFKMSQERRLGDRQGVIEGLNNLGSENSRVVAKLVEEYSDKKELVKDS